MPKRPLLILIDAVSVPDALHQRNGEPPPAVRTLRALDLLDDAPIAAPAIFCIAPDAARARGAFLVTSDQDGSAILIDPPWTSSDLVALSAAYVRQYQPTARARLVRAGDTPAMGEAIPAIRSLGSDAFEPADRKGCVVPHKDLFDALSPKESDDER